jgi:hypothetical protein
MLHSDPEFVHLCKVEKDEVDAVLNVTRVLPLLTRNIIALFTTIEKIRLTVPVP